MRCYGVSDAHLSAKEPAFERGTLRRSIMREESKARPRVPRVRKLKHRVLFLEKEKKEPQHLIKSYKVRRPMYIIPVYDCSTVCPCFTSRAEFLITTRNNLRATKTIISNHFNLELKPISATPNAIAAKRKAVFHFSFDVSGCPCFNHLQCRAFKWPVRLPRIHEKRPGT